MTETTATAVASVIQDCCAGATVSTSAAARHMGLRIFPELLDELLRHSRTTEFEVVFAELQRSQQALFKVRYVVLNIMRQDPVIRVTTAKQAQEPGRDQKYREHGQSEQDDRA